MQGLSQSADDLEIKDAYKIQQSMSQVMAILLIPIAIMTFGKINHFAHAT